MKAIFISRLFLGLLLNGSHFVIGIPQASSTTLPAGITTEQTQDAFPPRDPLNVKNWFGTSLYGWDKCDNINTNWKEQIKEAYTDANRLVNIDGVKSDIDWNSAAALEFFGPSAFNVNQQSQIQAVLANVATVKEGSTFTPNWIRARCDDPENDCATQCPSNQNDDLIDDALVTLAYSRNPALTGTGYPDICFCPEFFGLRNLDNAIAYGSGSANPTWRNNLLNYGSRAYAFLHELLHLDLAANSVNENPNPHIRDLLVKFSYRNRDDDNVRSGWIKAYAQKAKVLARYMPSGPTLPQTGYFVQRNVDNFVGFALSSYVQKQITTYPFLPMVDEWDVDIPAIPPDRQSPDLFIAFEDDQSSGVIFDNILTTGDEGLFGINANCPSVLDSGSEDLTISALIPTDQYPESYQFDRQVWLGIIASTLANGAYQLNIKEIATCEPSNSNLYASVEITGPGGQNIYTSPPSTSSPGQPINAANPLSIQASGLSDTLVITGEHTNDYIQFTYGATSWTSSNTYGIANCTLQGSNWDPNGPSGCPQAAAISREFNCQWPNYQNP